MNKRKWAFSALCVSSICVVGCLLSYAHFDEQFTRGLGISEGPKYALTGNESKNKLTTSSEYAKNIDTTLELDSKSNVIQFKGNDIKAADNSWQIINTNGYFQNIDHIIGMDSITFKTVNSPNAAIQIFYWHDLIDPNKLDEYYQSINYFDGVDGEYVTTCTFTNSYPNYIYVKCLEGPVDLSYMQIKLNDACKNFYYKLDVVNNTPEKGTVTGGGTVLEGTHEISAEPNPGYLFKGWYINNRLVNTSKKYRVQVTSSMTIEARFAGQPGNVVLDNDGAGQGTLIGAGTYEFGDSVTINAIPDLGYAFSYWKNPEGQAVTYNAKYTFTMGLEDVHLTSRFRYEYYRLNVDAYDSEAVQVSRSDTTARMIDEVSVTATLKDSYHEFVGWELDGKIVSTNLKYTFTMPTNDVTLYAVTNCLNVTANVNAYNIYSQSADAGKIYINDVASNSITAKYGTATKLEYKPDNNTKLFAGWYQGDTLLSSDNPYQYSLKGSTFPTNIQARITRKSTINTSLSASCPNGGTITPSKIVGYNDKFVIEAKPNRGYTFVCWENPDGSENTSLIRDPRIAINKADRDVYNYKARFVKVEVGKTYTFGYFPQSKVTDQTLVNAIYNAAGDPMDWDSFDSLHCETDFYETYSTLVRMKDVVYNGKKYRAIKVFETYLLDVKDAIFIWEPVRWKVINSSGYALSEKLLLTKQQFQDYVANPGGINNEGQKAFDPSKLTPRRANESFPPNNNYAKSDILGYINRFFKGYLTSSFHLNQLANHAEYNNKVEIPSWEILQGLSAQDRICHNTDYNNAFFGKVIYWTRTPDKDYENVVGVNAHGEKTKLSVIEGQYSARFAIRFAM